MTEAQLMKRGKETVGMIDKVLIAYDNFDAKDRKTLAASIEMFAGTSLRKKYDFQWRLIIQEIDVAEALHMKELAELQGPADPCEGLYDPWGIHQEIIDKLRALREQAQKQLEGE